MRNHMHIVEFPPIRCNNLVAGITAVVGIIGGVLLLTQTTKTYLGKISDRKKKKAHDGADYLCNVCCADIDPEDSKTFVKCYICQKHICRSIKCADWLPKTAQWECELCQSSKHSMAQTSSWVADQQSFNQQKLVYPMRARSEIFIPISECNDGSMHFESVSQIGAATAVITPEQKLKIREYVEELVAKMLGGNLDTIVVNQLSRSENYLLLFHKYHSRLSNILKNLENGLIFRAINKGGELSFKMICINLSTLFTDLPAPPPKTNGHLHPHHHPHIYTNGSISHGDGSRESTPGPDFTDISEARLRKMIQSIIEETIDMPPLSKTYAVSEIALDRPSKMADMNLANGGGLRRHRTEHYFEPTSYQDLLATAVLNKIVDKQSNNNRNMTESSPNLTRVMADGAEDVTDMVDGSGDMDQNYNMENQSITSGSSVEPRSDLSYTDTEPNVTTTEEKSPELLLNAGRESVMSDYLATHMVPLPDLSVVATESEMEDDYMSVTSSAVGDSAWENNWLFKKKKPSLAGGSISTSSVGMLVPDPKEDVRAQIGDKTADEISDLSELGSDTDDSSMDLLRANLDPVNNRLFNKHLIGGQNSKMVLDELIERSSMISNTLPLDQEEPYAETRNVDVDAPSKNEAINTNVNQQNNNNNNNKEDQKNLEVLNPPTGFEDDSSSSNPLADQLSINNTSQTDDDGDDDGDDYDGKSRLTSTEEMEDLTLSSDEITEERKKGGGGGDNTLVDKLEENKNRDLNSNSNNTNDTTTTIDFTNTTTTTSTTNTNSTNITANETIPDSQNENKLATNTNLNSTPPNNNTTTITPTNSNTPTTAINDQQTSDINPKDQEEEQLTQTPITLNGSSNHDMTQETITKMEETETDDDENDRITTLRKFLPGSIAEREYKKWYNAVEMPNNPYAPEALKRRISGSQERFIDLPNINASTEVSPLEMLTKDKVEADEANQRENEYRRYSRDYYINDGSAKSSQVSSPVREIAATSKDVVTEVNKPNNHTNINNNMNKNKNINETFENHTKTSSSNSKSKTTTNSNNNDCHWTLSTPVRRASSLKYLNHNLTSPTPSSASVMQQRLSIGSSRPATSASNYHIDESNDDYYYPQRSSNRHSHHHHRYSNRNYRYNNEEDNYEYNDNYDDEGVDEDPQLDLISQRSWKSSSALNTTTNKRRTMSMLSVFSGNSSSSRCGSVVSSRSCSHHQPDSSVLTQFEKQLLHKDLKRNSFRAVSATTKDFVLNPLFEKQQFFNGEGGLKLSIAKPKMEEADDGDVDSQSEKLKRHQQCDDQGGDSGVDSCLNGFSEKARDEVPETVQPPQVEKSETASDLYKAIPAQVVMTVEDNTTTSSSSLDTMSQQSLQSGVGGGATTSDDSDTIKIYNFKKQETTTLSREGDRDVAASESTKKEEATKQAPGETIAKERPTMLNISRQESTTPLSAGTTPTRGSTPPAFKFLQPKRKLLNPSQVLSQDDDDGEQPSCSQDKPDKPVIEKEVVHALPSVKALARAFLMTSSSSQHSAERIWPRKAKTIPGQLKTPTKSIVKPIESPKAEVDKSEEDATIASDLSSLETDPSSAGKTPDDTKDQPKSTTPANTPTTPVKATTTATTPTTPVRQGVLKSNIAFFENLKFK
ncbi:serine-rich adhesin for platelets [Musca vetustissima]|uniref:serine-rich adhesin for platelets n=1 Tax=Musca vetustissima TaxID=27455 RepID=UPI002AB716CE|nr:serine-rich adhesin for platelets [Musca vetustissima]